MKQLLPALVTTLCLTACGHKEDDPQPTDPAAQLTMVRTMTYPTAFSHDNGVTYTEKSLDGSGQLTGTDLVLSFLATGGNDDLTLTVPRAALTAGTTGTYALKTLTNASGPAVVSYSYYRINAPNSIHVARYRNSRTSRGELIITKFNAQRHLISGKFTVQLDNLPDPTDDRVAEPDMLQCNLEVTGTFSNLKLP